MLCQRRFYQVFPKLIRYFRQNNAALTRYYIQIWTINKIRHLWRSLQTKEMHTLKKLSKRIPCRLRILQWMPLLLSPTSSAGGERSRCKEPTINARSYPSDQLSIKNFFYFRTVETLSLSSSISLQKDHFPSFLRTAPGTAVEDTLQGTN